MNEKSRQCVVIKLLFLYQKNFRHWLAMPLCILNSVMFALFICPFLGDVDYKFSCLVNLVLKCTGEGKHQFSVQTLCLLLDYILRKQHIRGSTLRS